MEVNDIWNPHRCKTSLIKDDEGRIIYDERERDICERWCKHFYNLLNPKVGETPRWRVGTGAAWRPGPPNYQKKSKALQNWWIKGSRKGQYFSKVSETRWKKAWQMYFAHYYCHTVDGENSVSHPQERRLDGMWELSRINTPQHGVRSTL